MNHSSVQHPWFVESSTSPTSPKRDWYVWRADDPGWTQPWGGTNRTWHEKNGAFYYGVFWGGMPDLNFSTPAVREEYKPWDASPTGGFTTGRPWFGFAPGQETANVAAQTGDPGSLLSHYRNLIRARKSSSALQKGDLKLLTSGVKSDPVLAFVRESQDERVLVVHNLGAMEVQAGPYAVEGRSFEPVFRSGEIGQPAQGEGGWTVKLPAGASAVWRVK